MDVARQDFVAWKAQGGGGGGEGGGGGRVARIEWLDEEEAARRILFVLNDTAVLTVVYVGARGGRIKIKSATCEEVKEVDTAVRAAVAARGDTSLAKVLDAAYAACPEPSESDGGDEDESDEYEYASGGDDGGEVVTDTAATYSAGVLTQFEELRLRKVWEAQEAATRKRDRGSVLPASAAKVQSMFSSSGASALLVNELLNVMKGGHGMAGVEAWAEQDDVFNWGVRFGSFPEGSQMQKSLTGLLDAHGYSFVEVRISFVRDLFPFFPPSVTLVRPRLQGAAPFLLSCLPLLQLKDELRGWNPMRTMCDVVKYVHSELSTWGVVDIDDAANSLENESGAYTELERLLLTLCTVTEVQPRALESASGDYPTWFDDETAPDTPGGGAARSNGGGRESDAGAAAGGAGGGKPSTASSSKPTGGKPRRWAAGVGYSSRDDSSGWSVKAMLAARAEKDRQLQTILKTVAKYLSTKATAGDAEYLADVAVADAADVREAVIGKALDGVAGSCLLPVLARELSNDSTLDWERHEALYRALLAVVRALCGTPALRPALAMPVLVPGKGVSSIHALLRERAEQCAVALKYESAAKRSRGHKGSATAAPDSWMHVLASTASAVDKVVTFADPSSMPGVIDDETGGAGAGAGGSGGARGGAGGGARADGEDPDEAQYLAAVSAKRYAEVDDLAGHCYATQAEGTVALRNVKRARRLGQEHADLSKSLPLSRSSSVFVRAHADRMDVLRALIVGPEDTPYSGGCFIFDIFMPATYPNTPPNVQICTTGGGTVRFNPNLYANGKVCLSLLGTWSGGEGEGWSSETSTLLQVLVSIQSLILVPDPYFNEPGFQDTMHTAAGKAASADYSESKEVHTMQLAMVEQIKKPCPGFEDVIRTHFSMRRHFLEKQSDKWVADAKKRGSRHAGELAKWAKQLKAALKTLPRPPDGTAGD